ncbi:AIPR family protein [Hymenobacter glacieicola]|uniref:Abortive phage infection protein C-terminal domain-containing protein n=1 Tax=Hymenobacter glacieicola TaxID=1562124 RepID=A0ABQ1WLD8_9BACT|nr:AIPR family protein [Hymenobacter glacieicola]GGG35546.1 hypothetical protein GCM10011378_09750 [Hymenobacter glacieicola]
MPTPDEIKVQIEAVLRQRFFSMVPKIEKPGRENWTESQHDTDRLSRSLAAYTLVMECGIDDVTATAALTDGSDDKGMDAVFFDQLTKRLIVVQSKFKQNSPNEAEAQKTINGLRALHAKRFAELNKAFQDRQQEIEQALRTPGLKVEMIYVFLGDNFNAHASSDSNAYGVEKNVAAIFFSWKYITGANIFLHTRNEQNPVKIVDVVTIENSISINSPRRAFYGLMSAIEITRIVDAHGHALFNRNIRHYLGAVGVNPSILQTIKNDPSELFYLNNGITIVAEIITPSQSDSFELVNFSIVNGAQTAGSIAAAAAETTISPDAKVLATVIEVGPDTLQVGNRITKARNSQNRVNSIDFAALTPVQERLRQELAAIGITYYYRPSEEAQVEHDDTFKLESAALALACLGFPLQPSVQPGRRQANYNGLELVVTAKKEVGRLWEAGSVTTQRIFGETLTGIRTCRLVRIYRFIDSILAGSESSETEYNRRMLFRHGRYFIMAFVAKALPQVINRVDPNLSEEDKTVLSQQVDRLAERVYTVSLPELEHHGYLATFRNMHLAQPLADAVLQNLEQEVAQALQATPPIAPTT